MFKKKFLMFFAVFFMGIVFSFSLYGKEKDSFNCPMAKYVGDVKKRGNVKNATVAFDLLLNQEKMYDAIVSTSFLRERKKPLEYYGPGQASDGNRDTAWVEGKKGSGIGEKIYCDIIGFSVDKVPQFRVDFLVINGYARDKKLFKANNRVRKAKFTVYEAQWDVCGDQYAQRFGRLMKNMSKVVKLRDSLDEQIISMDVGASKSIKKKSGHSVMFMAELEILDVYKGSKFNDTCISEFRVIKVDKEKEKGAIKKNYMQ